MAQPDVPGSSTTRKPTSGLRRLGSGGAVSAGALSTHAIATALGADPMTAAAVAVGWGAVASAVGKVARDQLHAHETGARPLSPWQQILWTLGAAIG